MARRPDDTRGTLIFQEGKCIEGEYYVIAVYDDPSSCTISFSAYELENDCTYTYPLTYSEFDNHFRFDAELMNPANQDARFHWVIERLDFIQDRNDQKILCLASEPTPEEDDEELTRQPKKAAGIPPPAGGKIDPATRAKLLAELDTQDDSKMHDALVRSEDARKAFLTELFSRRQLHQLKATQRLLKADSARDERLAKLDLIKKQQLDKAKALKDAAEEKKSVQNQLQTLMKQKEAQNIRRLLQEKDEEDRGIGRERDAARQRKRMQMRSAAEIRAIEEEKIRQVAAKRDQRVEKREHEEKKRDIREVAKARQVKDQTRLQSLQRQDEKEKLVEVIWQEKAENIRKQARKRAEFLEMEEVRDRMNNDRDMARARKERDWWISEREAAASALQETLKRRSKIHRDALFEARLQVGNRQVLKRDQAKRDKLREEHIRDREEESIKLFRKQQFLSTARTTGVTSATEAQLTTGPGFDGGATATSFAEPGPASANVTAGSQQMKTVKRAQAEIADFQRSFEQQERQRRFEEREQQRKLEDAKMAKVNRLGPKDHNEREVQKIVEWQKEDAARRKTLEDARLRRELAQEEVARKQVEAETKREEASARLDPVRRSNSVDRAARRNEAIIHKTKESALGMGLPAVLSF
mmetsp:Transcript_15661/g.35231  ORF Transcript_15661/g.35231 Transcript_15661/m.35231 type:complete len:643 (-) Transcript_15661:104-2032(-)